MCANAIFRIYNFTCLLIHQNYSVRAFNWPEEASPYWTLKCQDNEFESVKIKASYLHSIDNKLSDKTLCMNGVQGENGQYRHFDVHNLYGLSGKMMRYF